MNDAPPLVALVAIVALTGGVATVAAALNDAAAWIHDALTERKVKP